jgi:acetyl-CoA synthetase
LLCDRHRPDAIALTVVDGDLKRSDFTFGQLKAKSAQVADLLSDLGIQPGDRVASLMGKSVDLVSLMLGTWRIGAVYVPLFTAFAPQAIAMRLTGSAARAVFVDAQNAQKLAPAPDMPEEHAWAIVHMQSGEGAKQWSLDRASGNYLRRTTDGSSVAGASESLSPIVHTFTSGTTGRPKGVVHPLAYVACWQMYLEYALNVVGDDTYWCAADPGWAYGLYGAIVTPLAMGRPTILLSGGFDPETTWRVLADLQVTNFAAAPTIYRALRLSGSLPADLHLRRASSAGEPLTPEVNEWALPTLGLEVHDHFGQTELGMILANHHHPDLARRIKPGSMGRPTPGWNLAILRPDEDVAAEVGELGRLAVDAAASPLMTFAGYGETGELGGRFSSDGRWYLTGDTARVDEDGDYFFSARDDDVIIMAGYRIGPFEIESVLTQHPSVAECAVVSAPDALRGEVLEAYVVLRGDALGSESLASELKEWVKERYAAHAYPRNVHFIDRLPKTPSGKIQRHLLREERRTQTAAAE